VQLVFQIISRLKFGDGEPQRFQSSGEVQALVSDLNRRLGLPPDSHLTYGQFIATAVKNKRNEQQEH